ncbi:MOB kinase activator-like 2 isoform X1 [Exaiptasia diaphana]|uniref:Uncharacterized protein n=1 Tax=Exaiptasia diaphana TaxID=2652724 RepID=A0A913WWB3_EXADI|nr:MOB kinase activator-like 2 isoform X1 [Exaiptasia diaphana]
MSLLSNMETTPWYESNFPWKYFFNAYQAINTQKLASTLPRKGKKKIINTEEVKENKPYLEEVYLTCTIMNKTEILDVLAKPEGIDYNEWIATHTLGHFNTINLLYGCISEVCTATTCPMMSAPGGLPYSWQGEEKGKKTKTLIPAPQYIDYVMTYVEKHVQDNTVFPSKFGKY